MTHSEHVLEASVEKRPGGQVKAVVPFAQNEPLGHGSQPAAPGAGATKPLAHDVQAGLTPPTLNRPALHGMGADTRPGHSCPLGHG